VLLFAWWDAKHAPGKVALFFALGILSFGILFTFSRNAFLGFFLVNALFGRRLPKSVSGPRSVVNAILDPSGDQAGRSAAYRSFVRRLSRPFRSVT
jgi:hypothetical protein